MHIPLPWTFSWTRKCTSWKRNSNLSDSLPQSFNLAANHRLKRLPRQRYQVREKTLGWKPQRRPYFKFTCPTNGRNSLYLTTTLQSCYGHYSPRLSYELPNREGKTGLLTRSFYALWMTMVVLLWDTLIVMIMGRDHIKELLGSSVFIIEKVAGSMLAIFGILLPFTWNFQYLWIAFKNGYNFFWNFQLN